MGVRHEPVVMPDKVREPTFHNLSSFPPSLTTYPPPHYLHALLFLGRSPTFFRPGPSCTNNSGWILPSLDYIYP